MSHLETYDLPKLSPVEADRHGIPVDVIPGTLVSHKSDLSSLGTCIARKWGPDDRPMQITVLWAKPPRSFTDVTFPVVRRAVTPLVANRLVGIQPMSMPSGSIFYMDYKYGSGSNGNKCNVPNANDKVRPWCRKPSRKR